jgi:hypothetical protein
MFLWRGKESTWIGTETGTGTGTGTGRRGQEMATRDVT